MRSRWGVLAIVLVCSPLAAQEPALSTAAQQELSSALLPKAAREEPKDTAIVRLGFPEVIARAISYNAGTLLARAETRRLIGLLWQARAASFPTLQIASTYSRLDGDRVLGSGDQQRLVAGANQLSGTLTVAVPLLAPARWAQWLHANDNLQVAEMSEQDARQKVATAAARAYLLVLSQKRLLEVAERARDLAEEHHAHAKQRAEGGVGNRLDEVRAYADRQVTEGQLHQVRATLRRAQELLGALIGQDEPVDVLGDPMLDAAPEEAEALRESLWQRTDLRLGQARAWAAARLLRHRFADWLPTLTGSFAPFFQDPPSIVQPLLGWQARIDLSWTLFDGGLRYGQKHEREALYQQTKLTLWTTQLQARAEVRAASYALSEARSTVAAARQAAQAASQAAGMARLAFRAGATSNMEALDAERRARDAESQLAQAEDAAHQAHLDLLIACGRFPDSRLAPNK